MKQGQVSRALHRRLVVTTILTAAPFLGYGRQAYAACVASPAPPIFVCSGDATVNTTAQIVNNTNAQVSTAPGFGVNSIGDGVVVFGNGNISFTDENASSITSPTRGLYVKSGGDYNGIPGTVTITTDGNITGAGFGNGIYGLNGGSGLLKITIAAEGAVTGGTLGIKARNYGGGDLEIIAYGDVTGYNGDAIYALINAVAGTGNLTITTGAESIIAGDVAGIIAVNKGSGDIDITVNGAVTATQAVGIFAETSINSGPITITTGSESDVEGSAFGIYAKHFGSGDITVIADGAVTGTQGAGIRVNNGGGGESIIKVGATGVVEGGQSAIRAYSDPGQPIAITNDGVVRNLSGNSADLAIDAFGGPVKVDNNNELIGQVKLGFQDDTLNNKGLWDIADGTSDFDGGSNDAVNNSGTLRAANDAATSEATRIINLEKFTNSGTISLVDGGLSTTDALLINASAGFVSENGKLAVDVALAGNGISDRLFIEGDTSGVTYVAVNLVGPSVNAPNPIAVVTVIGTTAQGDFQLEGGVLNAGLLAWEIKLDSGTHYLFTSGFGAGAYEFAAGITGAQDIWHQSTGALLQRQADLRALLAGTQVTPVADFSEPVEPTPLVHVTPGLWLKGVGAWLERDQDEGNNISTDRKQEIYGFLGGFDFGSENAGEAWLFGVFGGYLTSEIDFDQTNTEWQYEGPSLGAYVTWLNHAFYADLTVKADFLDVDIEASDIAPDDGEADTDVVNLGGLFDAGYKMPLTRGLFVEPQASLAVVHTEIDDIGEVMGGAVDFEDETSMRGRLGLRLGHELTAGNQLIYSSDVTASVWQEFAGDNDATIVLPLFATTTVSDDPGETFGDVSLGLSMQSPNGWSSFLRANYQFSEDYDAVAGNAGLRFAW